MQGIICLYHAMRTGLDGELAIAASFQVLVLVQINSVGRRIEGRCHHDESIRGSGWGKTRKRTEQVSYAHLTTLIALRAFLKRAGVLASPYLRSQPQPQTVTVDYQVGVVVVVVVVVVYAAVTGQSGSSIGVR